MAKLKITKQEAGAALEQAIVVVIGGPIIQIIPLVGGWIGMLPIFALGPVSIALPSVIAGAIAILGYNLVKAQMK